MMTSGYSGQPRDRKVIKNALFTLAQAATFPYTVNGASTWLSSSRRLKLFNAVDPTVQPAMFMVQHQETYLTNKEGHLTKRFLEMGLWCYARTTDPDIIGDDLLDSMLSGLEAALAPDDANRIELTLGGLVYWARIWKSSNMFIRDPGDIDGQALLVLPVRILLP